MKILKDGKIAYWCKTKEDAEYFFREAKEQGFITENNQAETTWWFGREQTCYVYNEVFGFGFNNKELLKEKGYEIIECIYKTKSTEERLKYLEDEVSKLNENIELLIKLINSKEN